MEKRFTINLDIMQLVKLESILQFHLQMSLQFVNDDDSSDFIKKFHEKEAKETSELLGLTKEAFERRD